MTAKTEKRITAIAVWAVLTIFYDSAIVHALGNWGILPAFVFGGTLGMCVDIYLDEQ